MACGPSAAAPMNADAVQTGQEQNPTSPANAVDSTTTGPYSVPDVEHGTSNASSIPAATPLPAAAATAADEIVFITQQEPQSLSTWHGDCLGSLTNAICQEIASDPLAWVDRETLEVVPLTGIESWTQHAPDRWRFKLRKGITFHNGEPWNAAAAKMGIDYVGDATTSGHGLESFRYHGVISGEVVDDLTVDVVCGAACPIFPRTALFTTFQAPQWWANASRQERAATTVGLGPYRIVKHVPGVEVRLEAYENYQSNFSADSRLSAVKHARQVWQPEPLARAAMLRTGEGHWAEDIGFESIPAVPVAKAGTTTDVFILVADNIWHPELRKKGIREALALAVDCELLMAALFDGLQHCAGNVAPRGASGINDDNSASYQYNPARASRLLDENDYDPANVIRIHTRLNPVYRSLEMLESVVTMWEAIGVNAELVVLDPATARDYRQSGCGQFHEAKAQLRCVSMNPPGPAGVSTHYYETVTSNEVSDLQRQLLLRASCHSVNSRVCNLAPGLAGMTFQESIADAIGTPSGPARTRKLEALAQVMHDEHWFLPLFAPAQVYGLAEGVTWEPRHDGRFRLNTVGFAE